MIDLARKDAFNGLEPTGDAAALDRVTDPEVPKLLKLMFNVDSPAAPRNDLVTIFLTGIPGLESAGRRSRLGDAPLEHGHSAVSVTVFSACSAATSRASRMAAAWATTCSTSCLQAAAGATPLTPAFNRSPNNTLGDGVNRNDVPYLRRSRTSAFLTPETSKRVRQVESRARVHRSCIGCSGAQSIGSVCRPRGRRFFRGRHASRCAAHGSGSERGPVIADRRGGHVSPRVGSDRYGDDHAARRCAGRRRGGDSVDDALLRLQRVNNDGRAVIAAETHLRRFLETRPAH